MLQVKPSHSFIVPSLRSDKESLPVSSQCQSFSLGDYLVQRQAWLTSSGGWAGTDGALSVTEPQNHGARRGPRQKLEACGNKLE